MERCQVLIVSPVIQTCLKVSTHFSGKAASVSVTDRHLSILVVCKWWRPGLKATKIFASFAIFSLTVPNGYFVTQIQIFQNKCLGMWYQWSFFFIIIDAFKMKHPHTHMSIFNLFPPLRLKLMHMCLPAAPPCTATTQQRYKCSPRFTLR